jgi:hypothetical protein
MEEDVGPVILINKFGVSSEELDQFIKGWAAEAKFKEQPGFISTPLDRGISASSRFWLLKITIFVHRNLALTITSSKKG